MKTIRHTTTLFYYDGPQVFEARDVIGGHYVAVMVEPEGGQDRYLVAGVEPDREARIAPDRGDGVDRHGGSADGYDVERGDHVRVGPAVAAQEGGRH